MLGHWAYTFHAQVLCRQWEYYILGSITARCWLPYSRTSNSHFKGFSWLIEIEDICNKFKMVIYCHLFYNAKIRIDLTNVVIQSWPAKIFSVHHLAKGKWLRSIFFKFNLDNLLICLSGLNKFIININIHLYFQLYFISTYFRFLTFQQFQKNNSFKI